MLFRPIVGGFCYNMAMDGEDSRELLKQEYFPRATAKRPKPEKLLEILESFGGNVSATARAMGISRPTVYAFMREYPEIAHAHALATNQRNEEAADKLWEHIEEGSLTALIFYLKTRAGWKETQVVEEDRSITITIKRAEELPATTESSDGTTSDEPIEAEFIDIKREGE